MSYIGKKCFVNWRFRSFVQYMSGTELDLIGRTLNYGLFPKIFILKHLESTLFLLLYIVYSQQMLGVYSDTCSELIPGNDK